MSGSTPTIQEVKSRLEQSEEYNANPLSLACEVIKFYYDFNKKTLWMIGVLKESHGCNDPSPPDEDVCDSLEDYEGRANVIEGELLQQAEDAGCDTSDW